MQKFRIHFPAYHKPLFSPAYYLPLTYLIIPILITSLLTYIPPVRAENLMDRVTNLIKSFAGFDLSPDPESVFIYMKKTPNYNAYAGQRSDFGGHRLRIERDGAYLDFSFAHAERNYVLPKITATPASSLKTDLTYSKDASLSANQNKILEDINIQLEDIKTDLSNISGKIKGVQTDVEKISREIGRVTSKASLIENRNERVVKFENILPATDFIYRLNEGGIKEEIILQEKPFEGPPNVFVFNLDKNDMDVVNMAGGVWYFFDKNNEPIFRIPRGWAKDGAGAINNDVDISIRDMDKKILTVTITVPSIWLSSPDRVYPIIIDPTVQVIPEKRVNTGFINTSIQKLFDSSTSSALDNSSDSAQINQITPTTTKITPSNSPAPLAPTSGSNASSSAETNNPSLPPSPTPYTVNPETTASPLPTPASTSTSSPTVSLSETSQNSDINSSPTIVP